MTFARELSRDDRALSTAVLGRLLPAHRPTTPTGLAGVLPAVARSLGVPDAPAATATCSSWRPSRRAVVVLVDGLGYDLLRQRSGHAPFLRGLLPAARRLAAGFPSTTATSMGTFGTGLPPGAHGLVGYEVLVPGRGPAAQRAVLGERARPAALAAAADRLRAGRGRRGRRHPDRAGLLRRLGPDQRRAARRLASPPRASLDARVDAAVGGRAPRRPVAGLPLLGRAGQGRPRPRLPVLGVGRRAGADRPRAGPAGRAACRPTPPCIITADHGMVDVPHALRIDLAHDAELAAGCGTSAASPGACSCTARPAPRPTSLATWRERLGDRAWVLSRDEAVAQGWFGPVAPRVLERIGDVVVRHARRRRRRRLPARRGPSCSRCSACTGRTERCANSPCRVVVVPLPAVAPRVVPRG